MRRCKEIKVRSERVVVESVLLLWQATGRYFDSPISGSATESRYRELEANLKAELEAAQSNLAQAEEKAAKYREVAQASLEPVAAPCLLVLRRVCDSVLVRERAEGRRQSEGPGGGGEGAR